MRKVQYRPKKGTDLPVLKLTIIKDEILLSATCYFTSTWFLAHKLSRKL